MCRLKTTGLNFNFNIKIGVSSKKGLMTNELINQ